MEKEPNNYRACLIPIVAFVGAGMIGNVLFKIVEVTGNYLAVIIMTIIFIPLLIFIIRCIIGTQK